MTISEMLAQSGLLTLLGIGVVFSFLIILIICMRLLQSVVHALKMDGAEEKKAAAARPQAAAVPAPAAAQDDAVIAVIAAAVHDRQLKA
ncbi:MAG: OadG family protein [Treponemataceae bacterium]|nr:OadG family protein [Treponemataceae bacterium]